MNVHMSEGDISRVALMGADIRRFLRLLELKDTLGIDPEMGSPVENPFDLVELKTTWGLVVAIFSSSQGKVTKAFNVDLLTLTKDLVISNDGIPVDRYDRIIEELLRLAVAQLHDSPSALPLIRPAKDILRPTVIRTKKSAKATSHADRRKSQS